ncbi:serine hydrolase [Leptolyngbya sp. FACHB-711]|uniref:serine hydrolase n=1 Tax=unclassified Leptolyngbya TaxID=2650499 RepID=UPI0016865786|nr:serine hydrolase [Leptolyngbya sp. FACHB-711]MBD1850314.1 serine hydrolase [Cyanobacteria bacterium FACHB-502]MBD2026653.1 serine hydrolase [Leptolyngbya sp. FACHB-711]
MPFFYRDAQLEQWGDRILEATWAAFPGLTRTQLAITWLIYDEPIPVNTGGALTPEEFWKYPVRGFSYRGVEQIYPASVVKLFYLVAVAEWLEQGMIQPSAELDRAVRDMIVDSSNDATSLVMDMLTGTTSGPELPPEPFETWKSQRNLVNRYFQSLGWIELEGINVNQKTWCDGPYGRERAFLGELRENRNTLTTEATARLMHSLIGGVAVSSSRSQAMMTLMQRSLNAADLAADPENQVTGFLGEGLPTEAKLWSKAGWTSQVRHDAAYVELPNALPYVLVVFTEGKTQSQNEKLLPFISGQVAECVMEG